MDCQACNELLTALVDDELSAPEKKALETHLIQCRPCRQEQESLLDSYHLVDQLSYLEMDPALWTGIHSRITHLPANKPAWFSPFQSFFGIHWIPVTAGTLGVFILSFFFLSDPQVDVQQEFQVYLEEREQMVLRPTPLPPQEGMREIRTGFPNPFTVSYDSSQRNPFVRE
jgi:hypothetical protein